MADQLEELLDEPTPTTWRWQDDPTLIGEVASIALRDAGYGDYPVLTVRKADGSLWTANLFHAVAQAELAREQPKAGERIGLRYLGEQADGSRRYHLWRIRVDPADRAAAAIDWKRIADNAQAELGEQ